MTMLTTNSIIQKTANTNGHVQLMARLVCDNVTNLNNNNNYVLWKSSSWHRTHTGCPSNHYQQHQNTEGKWNANNHIL